MNRDTIIDQITEAFRLKAVDAGDLSAIADYAVQLSKQERKAEGRRLKAKLRIGMTVRIKHDAPLRPKYILGTMATIVSVNRTKAKIQLGDLGQQGRFQSGDLVHCPIDCLEIVEGE